MSPLIQAHGVLVRSKTGSAARTAPLNVATHRLMEHGAPIPHSDLKSVPWTVVHRTGPRARRVPGPSSSSSVGSLAVLGEDRENGDGAFAVGSDAVGGHGRELGGVAGLDENEAITES